MVAGGFLFLRAWLSTHGYSLSAERLAVEEVKDHNEARLGSPAIVSGETGGRKNRTSSSYTGSPILTHHGG